MAAAQKSPVLLDGVSGLLKLKLGLLLPCDNGVLLLLDTGVEELASPRDCQSYLHLQSRRLIGSDLHWSKKAYCRKKKQQMPLGRPSDEPNMLSEVLANTMEFQLV